jgi:hypothetical protein
LSKAKPHELCCKEQAKDQAGSQSSVVKHAVS